MKRDFVPKFSPGRKTQDYLILRENDQAKHLSCHEKSGFCDLNGFIESSN